MILYNFIKYFLKNLKYSKILNKVYKDERLLENLSQLFNAPFRKDRLGRIYVVLNPNIHNKEYDNSTQIFEYNEVGLDNTMYVEKWIMDKLNIAQQFIQTNNLFDMLTYKIEKLDEYDNYLFIIQPITLEDSMKWAKRFLWIYGVIITILAILHIII